MATSFATVGSIQKVTPYSINAVACPDNTPKITYSQCYARVVARDHIEKLTGSCRCPDKNHVNNAHESSSDDNASNLKIFYSRAAAHGFDTHKQGDGKERRNQAWTSIELAARFMSSTYSWIITTGSQWIYVVFVCQLCDILRFHWEKVSYSWQY